MIWRFRTCSKTQKLQTFKGVISKKLIDKNAFIKVTLKISTLLTFVPKIEKFDLSQLLIDGDEIIAVVLKSD
jgi:hypothetical protein